jgi:hypothetical protein
MHAVQSSGEIIMGDDSGFRGIIDNLTAKKATRNSKPVLGHSFIGYRRKSFDEFIAVFKADVGEFTNDKYTCEQRVRNATPGTESHESAQLALKHWPIA